MDNQRLPQTYIPTNYLLFLHITENEIQFDASVTISFRKNCEDQNDNIYLNLDSNITIKNIYQNNINLEYTVEFQKLIIFPSKEPQTDYISKPITIEYLLKPNRNVREGFYIYGKSYLTDLEPCGARKLLPCFDEPFVRSTFSVKLLIPSELTALSNMPIKSIKQINQENEVTFFPTPPMSTYLICICVGVFSSINGITNNGTSIKYYTHSGQEKKLKDYLDAAVFSMNWLESKLQVRYELPHLQLISVKGGPAGMENYGLITLPDYTRNPEYFSMRATVVMHEIVHQWFGDLVCIKYWDSLWLNEGFAEFIQYLILRDYKKDLDVWELFVEDESNDCLNMYDDGVVAPDDTDIDLDCLFDSVTYSKGAFVVKMFYDLIGEENFFLVCKNFLNQYKNKCADVYDFIKVVNSTLNEDWNLFFDSWLRNYGFPVLIVNEIEHNLKNVGVEITQVSKNDCIFKLKIPILFSKDGKIKKEEIIIENKMVHIDLEYDWIIINDKFSSLCFVIYSKKILKALIDPENLQKISILNRNLIYKSINNEYVTDLIDEEMKEMSTYFFK